MNATADAGEGRVDTFPKYLLWNAVRFAGRPSMRHKDYGIWRSWSWDRQLEEVRAFSLGLRALGFSRGDKVAIAGSNRPRLYWSFAALQALGVIPVPVYADAVAEEMAFVLDHAGVRFAIVEDQEQVDKLLSIAARVPSLKDIVYDEPRGLGDYDQGHLHAYEAVRAKGLQILADDPAAADAWLAEIAAGKGSDLGIILYTSGTTGRPKGVMLSNDNLVKSALRGSEFDRLTDREALLAYFPLAWAGDHLFYYAQSHTTGFCICCPESAGTIDENRHEIAPTYFFAPPRVLEAMLTATIVRMQDAGRVKKAMFDFFLAHARRVGEPILDGAAVGLWDRLLYALGNFLVYAPLKNRMGFLRLRVAYTAGEAIGAELFRFYRSIGVNLKQLYGQTEATVYVTAQKDGQVRADTVGTPYPGVEIRVDENGEVLCRSDGVFTGYYKEDDKTAEVLTSDGFIRTGDAGFFEADGQLKIIDRAKDVGKLKDGSLFAPKYIENMLKFFPNIKEAVAFGDGRAFCAAFINIDLTAVGNWAERNNIAYASYQELAGHPQVYAIVAGHVEEANRRLAREPMMAGGQIARFLILHKELDADDGELTRTQKVRRSFIAERYGALIEALYDGSTEKHVETQVTFEDGRKGRISATVRIADAAVQGRPVAAHAEAAE